ncbi:MAG: DNA-processing protein DprA [Patescibacteria group bacterium]|nr:DNA-processing protein DprA [Patescibacteria group bacterium]
MENLKYWVALNNFQKFGPIRFKKLLKHFLAKDAGLENAFRADISELMKAGIEENIAEEFSAAKREINPDQLIARIAEEDIKVMTIADKSYPALLGEIYNPPSLIYYKGEFDLKDDFTLAVVGTRKFTNYGQQVTDHIVRDLAKNGLTIVSGLALGIDSLAHLATLETGGKTIAVLGSGLDKKNIYPSQNRYLAEKIIASGGAIISELPLGTPPLRHNFPQRNRLISGLSLGTLVIEAGEKSGALITAAYALEQNREVFAVPGSINSLVSAGPNKLIKEGAKVVTSAADVIETLNLTQATAYIDTKKIMPEGENEKKIIALLSFEPIHIDELVRASGLDTAAANSTLVIMEMKGMIKNLGGMYYILAR